MSGFGVESFVDEVEFEAQALQAPKTPRREVALSMEDVQGQG